MAKKSQPLTINEAYNGFTQEFTFDFNEFLSATAGTLSDRAAHSLTFGNVDAGTLVRGCSFKLVTAFDDSGSGDELDITVGITGGDVDGLIAATEVHVDATEVTYGYNSGALVDDEDSHIFTAAVTDGTAFTVTLTPDNDNNTPYSLNELTQGEVKIKLQLFDLN